MAVSVCSLNEEFSLTDSSLKHAFFGYKYIIFMAKWLLVVNASLTMFIPLLMKTENIVFCFFFFSWCLHDVKVSCKKLKSFIKTREEITLIHLYCKRNVLIPSTPDLKKKLYVLNLGYFSNDTSWFKNNTFACKPQIAKYGLSWSSSVI